MAAGELEHDESILDEIRGKTQREVEEILARRWRIPRKRDRIQAVSEATPSGVAWEVRFTAGRALREKFEQARAILSKKHPEGVAYEQVFERRWTSTSSDRAPGRRSERGLPAAPAGGVIGGRAPSRRRSAGRSGAVTRGDARIGARGDVAADPRGTWRPTM
jgi:hypothetical protein